MTDDRPEVEIIDDSLAKQRFATLGVLRFGGVGTAIVGLLLLGEKLSAMGPAIDRILGGTLVVGGVLAVLILPALIARRWKNQSDQ